MNWMNYSMHEWPKLVPSAAAYSKKVPVYFAKFVQTKESRLENVRKFLVAHGIALDSGYPNWLDVGDWLIANVDGPAGQEGNSAVSNQYELRWRSLCCDIGTLFGEQLISLFPNLFWDYYVGNKREIGANQIVVTSVDVEIPARIFALSCISASRARIGRLKFPTAGLTADVSQHDLMRELSEEKSGIASYFDLCVRNLTTQRLSKVRGASDNPFLPESQEWQEYEKARILPGTTSLLVESLGDDANRRREWVRVVPDFGLRGVSLETESSIDHWVLWANISEQLVDDDLYDELQIGIEATLRNFEGVTHMTPVDREIWHVYGNVDGSALIDAVGSVVDGIAARLIDEP